jgi:preprotein translocase subunit SecA
MAHKLRQILISPFVERDLKKYYPVLAAIRSHEAELKYKGDEELRRRSEALKRDAGTRFQENDFVVESYALACEAAYRTLRMRPFDVQIIGALALKDGNVVEMQTGEGKTLTAVLPAFYHALNDKGVHLHTFNDYLAKRDALWMKPVYDLLGISVGYIQEVTQQAKRKEIYKRDVVYLTAKEGGFDYLRTFLVHDCDEIIQRKAGFAIVDEVDSILIDEARIPLVIAGEMEGTESLDLYQVVAVVRRLKRGIDFQTDRYAMNVFLTEEGIAKVEHMLGYELYKQGNENILVRVNQALHAHVLLKRDVDYIVRHDIIEQVDELTGRIVDNRKWPHGLQASVEAKENLPIQREGKILGKTTLQHFFAVYPKISGMTGTAQPAAEEFSSLYGLPVVVIPPNKPVRRIDQPDVLFSTKHRKINALTVEIGRVNSTGRPILVGTSSVEESESIAAVLRHQGIACQVLNARNDEEEAMIVSRAGLLGTVTISTNMAGRGTDIKLGGEHGEYRDAILRLGGLYVIGINRFESRRIDNQLRGRAGRQGDPGESKFFISLQDDLLQRHGINELIPSRYRNQQVESSMRNAIINREVNRAQRIIEGKNFDIRRTLWKYASLLEVQRKIIHQLRSQTLDGTFESILKEGDSQRYENLVVQHGQNMVRNVEGQVIRAIIDRRWADYLRESDLVRQSIHMVAIGGMNPMREYQKSLHESFTDLLERIDREVTVVLQNITISDNGIDLRKEGLLGPTSSWTYLINDNPFGDRFSMMLNAGGNIGFAAGAALLWPLLSLYFIVQKIFRRRSDL